MKVQAKLWWGGYTGVMRLFSYTYLFGSADDDDG